MVSRRRSYALLIFLAFITPFLAGIIYFGNYHKQAAAAISYVGSSSRSASIQSSQTLTITKPTTIATGDVMIAHVMQANSTSSITPPSGWNVISMQGSTGIRSYIYYKAVTTSEPSSYSWTFSGSTNASGGISAYRGLNTALPIYMHAVRLSGCPLTGVSINVPNNAMLVFAGGGTANIGGITPPSGMTERYEQAASGSTSYMADQIYTTGGSTGQKQAACSSGASGAAHMVALNPAVAPATPTVIPTPTPIVGCTTSGIDFVLIFDRSGSMNDENRMTLAKQAAKNFIDSVAGIPNSRIALVSFESVGDETTDINFTTNFTQAKSVIDSYPANGLTCTRCGMTLARQQFQNNGRANAKKVAILFTDGQPWHSDDWYDSNKDEEEVQNVIDFGETLWVQNQIQMYAIGLGTAKFEDFLPDLVSFSNGRSYIARYGNELGPFYTDIVNNVQPKGSISGYVFHDQNRNGAFNSEPRLQGWEVVLTMGATTARRTTDASGNYSFTNICDGNHRVSVTEQPNWVTTLPLNPTYYNVSIVNGAAVTNRIFGVSQGYIITGNVFNDINKNGIKEASEQNYSGIPSISATRNGVPIGTITTGPGGYYQISGLTAGTVVVSFSNLPEDYSMTYPLNGPPPSFQVTVGPGCDINGSRGASCQ